MENAVYVFYADGVPIWNRGVWLAIVRRLLGIVSRGAAAAFLHCTTYRHFEYALYAVPEIDSESWSFPSPQLQHPRPSKSQGSGDEPLEGLGLEQVDTVGPLLGKQG